LIQDRLYLANTRIFNGDKFPEGNTEGYGFTKAARSEKVGFISTDTNDRLYVSPKYLDAWRIKRQLLSASAVSLDNNRIYLQTPSTTLLDGTSSTTSDAVTTTSSIIYVKESAGLPSTGQLDVLMTLRYVDSSHYVLDSSTKVFLNPFISLNLKYETVDYTNNSISLASVQNTYARQTYIEDILGKTGNNVVSTNYLFNKVIKSWSCIIDDGPTASETSQIYLGTKLAADFTVGTATISPSYPQTLSIKTDTTDSLAKWNLFPNRGAVTLREQTGTTSTTLKYATFVYVKSSTQGQLILVERVLAGTSSTVSGSTVFDDGYAGNNVFFSGCDCSVIYADKWASEKPFIPNTETISEDVDLDSATLHQIPEKPPTYTGAIDKAYTDKNVPNPYSSKALGPSLQNRLAVKEFRPLATLSQAAAWCTQGGFVTTDTVELLMKPGYYQLDSANFPCRVKINGSGVSRTGGAVGKETASVSSGRIGGYTNTSVKRADSVYFYRPIRVNANWQNRSNEFYVEAIGKIQSQGGLDLQNVHFISLGEAIVSNEIVDSDYGGSDSILIAARQRMRRAWFVKKSNEFPAASNAITGGLSFLTTSTGAAGKGKMEFFSSTTTTNSSGEFTLPSATTYTEGRHVKFTLTASNFTGTTGTPSDSQKYKWAKNYIIPGSTLYFIPGNTTLANVTSSTKAVKILDVNIKAKDVNAPSATTLEEIEFICATTNGVNGNTIEDLILESSTQNAQIVITNQEGDEIPTLIFNWLHVRRKQFLPHDFVFGGSASSPSSPDTISDSGYISTNVTAGGNALKRYDKPEIFGIIAGFSPGTINLVIDTNPTADSLKDPIDGSALTKALIPYPYANEYLQYKNILLEYKDAQGEEAAVAIPYFPNGPVRIAGRKYPRFYILQVNPADIANNPDNIGLNATILSYFTNFNSSTLQANGSIAIIGGTGTISGDTTSFANLSEFVSVAKGNLAYTTVTNPYKKATNRTQSLFVGAVQSGSYAVGKFNYIHYAYIYRYSKKRFLSINDANIGNIGGKLIQTDASLGGTANICSLTNVTIGAQSPPEKLYNRTGGTWRGGLISAKGSSITLSGVRFRGNVSLDFTGLIVNTGGVRTGAVYSYGHSVELFQVEDETRLSRFGQQFPAEFMSVSKNDEQFKHLYENRNASNLYLEPFRNPYGELIDYDRRTFPVSCYQSIKRFVAGNAGSLNTSQVINERYQSPYRIIAGTTHSSSSDSGTHLRINRSTTVTIVDKTIIGTSNPIIIPPRSVAFKYYNDDVVDNIFYGQFATKLIRASNQFTSYGNVTKINSVAYGSGVASNSNPKVAVITFDGNSTSSVIPTEILGYYNGTATPTVGPDIINGESVSNYVEVTNSADYTVGAAWDNTNSVKFLTQYLNSNRYNYITTVTSRYEKTVDTARGYLRLNSTGTPVYAIHSDIKITSSNVPSLTKGSTPIEFVNSKSGTTNLKAYVTTNSSGAITSFDIVSYGFGHLKDNILIYTSGSNKIELKCLRALEGNIELFDTGEFMVVPPRHCFVLNNINATSLIGVKKELEKVKSIIKPFSYIRYGSIYYKIANDTTYEPYISIYAYVNEANLQDVRYSIVVRLEDNTYAPIYPATSRFDVYETESILDYWPSSGRVQLGDVELADFTKGTYSEASGYPLTITRSNTKYWPSYIRDFEGLDPETEDVDVSVEQFVPTTIQLADPIDVTCAGLRKTTAPSTSNNGLNTLTVPEYITPDGKKTTERLVITIPTTSTTQTADAKKYNVGDIIHLPYRRTDSDAIGTVNVYKIKGYVSGTTLTVPSVAGLKAGMTLTKTSGTGVFAASTTISSINTTGTHTITLNTAATTAGEITFDTKSGTGTWEDIVCTVVSDTTTDSSVAANRAGCVRIKATVNMSASGQSISWTNPNSPGFYQWFHVVPPTSTNATIYNKVNPIGVVRFENSASSVTYSATPSTVTLLCSNALLSTLSTGDTFSLVPMFKTIETVNPVRVLKTRIVDIEIPAADTSIIKLHTADPSPELFTDSGDTTTNWRYFGFFFVNHNGYTYPRNGGSSVRVNNVIPGTPITSYTATGTSTSYTITLSATPTDLLVGMSVSGTGIGSLAKITAISGTTVTLSVANSAAVSGTITFGTQNLIKLPNFNDRIKIGDIVKYSYEEVAPSRSGGITATIANSAGNNIGNILTIVNGPTTGNIKVGMSIYGDGIDEGTLIQAQLSSTTFRLNNSFYIPSAATIYPYSSPSAQYTYIGTVLSVGTKDATSGYSTILLSDNTSAVRNVLDTTYANKAEWATIDDVFISHRSNNFTEDGPICTTFLYSGNGVKLTASNYSIWNENYNVYLTAYLGISSRQGWVGNWGLTRNGDLINGFETIGSSSIIWTNQHNDTMWISAQPTIPLYWGRSALAETGSDINIGASVESMFTSSDNGLAQYTFSVGTHRQQVIQHTSLLSDDIFVAFNTSNADAGGHDALDVSRYQLSGKPTLEYVLRDAVISSSNATSSGGSITPGTGKNKRLFEQLICDYTTYYKPVYDFSSVDTYTTTSYSQLKLACNNGEYSWRATPIQLTTTAITGATPSTGFATYTFATQTAAPYSIGQIITVTGATAAGFNGIFTVISCSTTAVVVTNGTTGTASVQGTITSSIASTGANLVGLAPGDAIYAESAGTYIGTIATINSDGLSGTFVQPSKAAIGSVSYASAALTPTLGNIRVVSPRATKIGPSLSYTNTANPTSNSSIAASGLTGTNVIAPSQPHFNQYNFRYSLDRRNYNATPLVNTEGVVKAVNTYNFASDAVNVSVGDICKYKSSLMNVQITRLNNKVHIERSITVAGRPVFNI